MGDAYKACRNVSRTEVYAYMGMGLAVGYTFWNMDEKRENVCAYGDSGNEAELNTAIEIDRFCFGSGTACNETGYTLCEGNGDMQINRASPILKLFSDFLDWANEPDPA